MTRIEPDGYLPRSMVGYADDAAVFLRSTVLRAIDDLRGKWNPELSHDHDEEAYLSGGDHALTNLRAHFQPTEGSYQLKLESAEARLRKANDERSAMAREIEATHDIPYARYAKLPCRACGLSGDELRKRVCRPTEGENGHE